VRSNNLFTDEMAVEPKFMLCVEAQPSGGLALATVAGSVWEGTRSQTGISADRTYAQDGRPRVDRRGDVKLSRKERFAIFGSKLSTQDSIQKLGHCDDG
jgi:hypothetical protein